MQQSLETDLLFIENFVHQNQQENDSFVLYLKSLESTYLDATVLALNEAITPKIDCTKCGNCCKTLMINVTDNEANNLANHLQESREKFDEKYIETGSSGMMILNKIPCHFLKENKCTVYEFRFEGCKEFPAMHLPHFKERLFTTFMNYARCPIIFNIVEHLKTETNFKKVS